MRKIIVILMTAVIFWGASLLNGPAVLTAQEDVQDDSTENTEGFNPETIEGFSTEMEEIIGDQPLQEYVVEPSTPEAAKTTGLPVYWIAGGALLVLGGAALAYYALMNRKNKSSEGKRQDRSEKKA